MPDLPPRRREPQVDFTDREAFIRHVHETMAEDAEMACVHSGCQAEALEKELGRVVEARDHALRLFNRLEKAVTDHKAVVTELEEPDQVLPAPDEALYAAHARIMRDAAKPDLRRMAEEGD